MTAQEREVIWLWRKMRQDRQSLVLAIMRYIVSEDEALREGQKEEGRQDGDRQRNGTSDM
jgi:hypothetical protein